MADPFDQAEAEFQTESRRKLAPAGEVDFDALEQEFQASAEDPAPAADPVAAPVAPGASASRSYMDPALAEGAAAAPRRSLPEMALDFAKKAGMAALKPASALAHGGTPQDEGSLAAKSLASGYATVGRGLGAGLEIAGAEDLGKTAYDYWTERQKAWAPPQALQRDILDAPEMLADTRWWAANAPQVLGTMLPFMVPAAGGAAGALKLAQAARLGARGQQVAALVGGNVASTASNALFEGALAYKSAEEAGASKEAAAAIAAKVAKRNAVWTALTNTAGMMNPVSMGVIKRAALSAVTEGAQEAGEEYIPAQALNAEGLGPAPKVSGSAFVLGALGGGPAGVIIDSLSKVMEESGLPPEQARAKAAAAVAQAVADVAEEPEVPAPAPEAPEEAPAAPVEEATAAPDFPAPVLETAAQAEGGGPAPEAVPEPEMDAMAAAIAQAQARAGGDPEAVREALAMPPEAAPEQSLEEAAAEMAAEAPPAAPALPDEPPPDWDEAISALSQPTPEEVAAAPELLSERPVYEQPPEEIVRRFPGIDDSVARRLQEQAEYGIQKAMEATLDKESPTPAMDVIRKAGGISIENLKKNNQYGEAARLQSRGLFRKDGALKGWDHVAEILHEAGLIGERDISAAISLLEDEARKGSKKDAKRMGPGAAAKAQFAVRKPDLLPEEVVRSLEAAKVKAGSEVATLRDVKDPVFGNLKKGEKVTVLSVDAERGQVLVEYGEPEFGGKRPVHVIPVEAIVKPVKNAPAPAAPGPAEVKSSTLKATGVVKEDPVIALKESRLLRERLRNQMFGAREATKAAKAEMREKLGEASAEAKAKEREAKKVLRHEIEQAFVQEKWEQATRNKVAELARLFLPLSERGAFIGRAVSAKTQDHLTKVYHEIVQRSNEVANKAKMKNIRILVDRIMDSPTFPVEIKKRVQEMLSDVNLESWSEKTLAKFQVQQEFIDHLRATGADVVVPQSLLDRLAKLNQRPLSELEPDELDNLVLDLRFLLERGTEIRAGVRQLEAMEKEEKLAEIKAGTVKPLVKPSVEGRKYLFGALKVMPTSREFRGAALTWAQERKNGWLRWCDRLQRAGISITPIQVVIDSLDGTLMGGGVNRRILFDPLQAGYSAQQAAIAKAHDFLAGVLEKHGAMTQQQQERITTVLMREQEGGREKLHQLGDTDDAIDAVKLTPEEQATLDALRGYLNEDARVNALARVTEKLYNQAFEKVKNYWPMMTDFEAAEGPSETKSAQEALLEELDTRRKNVKKGIVEKRVEGAKQKIRADIYAVFADAVSQGAMLEHMAEPILKAHALVSDPAYKEAAGDAGQEFWRDYLDVLARDGRVSAARRNLWLDNLRRNMSTGALTFKPHVALVQLSSIPQGAALTGGKAMRQSLAAGPEWDAFVEEHMPLVSERKGGDEAVRSVLQGQLLSKMKAAGFKHIVKSDYYAAAAVAKAAYFQWCDIHNVKPDAAKPNKQGIMYAQGLVGRSMSSPWLVDMPLALSRGNLTGNRSVDRAVLQFQSESLSRFAMVRQQILGEAKNDPKGAASKAAFLTGAMIYEAGVRSAWKVAVLGILYSVGAISKDQYDDQVNEDDLLWKQLALSAVQTIPFVGAVGNSIVYDSSMLPTVDVVMDAGKGGFNFGVGTAQGKPYKATRGLLQALTATAMLAGVPGSGMVGWIARQPFKGVRDKQARPDKKKKKQKFAL